MYMCLGLTYNKHISELEREVDWTWLVHLSSGFCWIGFNLGVDQHWVIQFRDHLGLSSPSWSQLVTLRQLAGLAQGRFSFGVEGYDFRNWSGEIWWCNFWRVKGWLVIGAVSAQFRMHLIHTWNKYFNFFFSVANGNVVNHQSVL